MLRAAALLGSLAVACGAFGAHGLREHLAAQGTAAIWETGALYHLVHAVALLAVALHHSNARVTGWLWIVGITIFSGSLYVLAFTGMRWLGAVTPIGGLLLIAGWAALAWPRRTSSGG